MFVVEVSFLDRSGEVESVLLQRSSARIGTSETSHLILDGVKTLPCELEIVRGIGRRFRCLAVDSTGDVNELAATWCGEYDGHASIDLGEAKIFVTSVDSGVSSLFLTAGEDCLSDGLFHAFYSSGGDGDLFPALQCISSPRVTFSIGSVPNFYVGRSRKCLFRIDDRGLRPEHVLIKEKDGHFFIEPQARNLMTSVNGRHLSDERVINGGDRIELSKETTIIFLQNKTDMEDLAEDIGDSSIASDYRSPLRLLRIIDGPHASPRVLPLRDGQTITIGRDPSHSMWIDAPFVSRLHTKIVVYSRGYEVTDYSTNGTRINGELLEPEKPRFFPNVELTLSLGTGVNLLVTSKSGNSMGRHNELPQRISDDGRLANSVGFGESEESILAGINTDVSIDLQATDNEAEPAIGKIVPDLAVDMVSPGTLLEEYQRRTLRQLSDSDSTLYIDPSLSQTMEHYSYETTNNPGIQRFLPILLVSIILGLLAIFIILAKHIVH